MVISTSNGIRGGGALSSSSSRDSCVYFGIRFLKEKKTKKNMTPFILESISLCKILAQIGQPVQEKGDSEVQSTGKRSYRKHSFLTISSQVESHNRPRPEGTCLFFKFRFMCLSNLTLNWRDIISKNIHLLCYFLFRRRQSVILLMSLNMRVG